jgi:hypothetical protein
MMAIEPTQRCTLSDLLRGKGKGDGILCGCEAAKAGADHTCSTADGDVDEGDEWIKSISSCSDTEHAPTHIHVKVVVEEKHKKRFF